MYKILRSILFWFDAEKVHYFSMNILRALCDISFIRKIISNHYTPVNSQRSAFNILFKNPVGLGAGFDKNAKYLRELETLGFGSVEIGTVTPQPQEGNPKPRLFRLPKDKALINRMGFNNDGAVQIALRLKSWREYTDNRLQTISHESNGVTNQKAPNSTLNTPHSTLIIGGNIGKNKSTPNELAWKDYEICFDALHSYVDYFVVNVSSPNTPGLRELQEKESLRKIFTALESRNKLLIVRKPILLKIAPDLSTEQIDDVIDLALEINLDGLIATNTTVSRTQLKTKHSTLKTIAAGGLSGAPLKDRSTEIVKYIHQKTGGKIPVIANGGIFSGEDALQKINAGAVLVQVWTGFIYEGPAIVKKIMKELAHATHNPQFVTRNQYQ